jgi:hypothetical protein
MEQEMESSINRARFHRQAPAHIRIMLARRNAKGATTSITHQYATAEMAMRSSDIFITAARSVDKGGVNVQENQSFERLKIHAVPLAQYVGKGTADLENMREE